MPARSLLYYITDRKALAPDEPGRRRRLVERIAQAMRAGVDFIQLREKDLPTRELESLAREVLAGAARLRAENPKFQSQLLINSRVDVALGVGADGVHLRADDLSAGAVRAIWEAVAPSCRPLIGASCHSQAEIVQATEAGASFAVFGPVFEKPGSQPAGLARLRQAAQGTLPVLALGGITLENAPACLGAGAAGIAAIRLFQENDIAATVHALRPVGPI
jgi:thiamine-phosphate pyrophosphorylase